MKRRRLPALFLAASLAAACGDQGLRSPPELAAAERAWEAFADRPTKTSFDAFLRANRAAAHRNGEDYDAIGVLLQLRALEAQALWAERTGDSMLAGEVVDRVRELESRDLVGIFEEAVPGAADRLAAARGRAVAVLD